MEKSNKRWFVVFGAVLLQVCLGAIYSWSLFNQPLMDKFGWTKDQVVLTYSIAIFVFAFSTIFSGRLADKIGPRKVATIGGILYGTGMILASFASSLPMLYFSYGVLAGAGVGFAYVCPLSTCVKWFPEKKGFITGIAVGAFGAGSLIFKSVIEFFIENTGVSSTFLYLGIIYMVLVVIGAQFLILPKVSAKGTKNKSVGENSYTAKEMMKTKSFYMVWIMYMFGCMPGLLVIGLAKDIGIEMVKLTPVTAANAVGLIALFNAGGRLAWGTISDKLGRVKVVTMMFIMTAVALLVMSLIQLNYVTFFLCLAAIAFSYGGFLAVFPTITGQFFGQKNLGANYGIIYQAYGIAALIGPIIKGNAADFNQTFLIAAGFAVLGMVISLLVKAPVQNIVTLETTQTKAV
ncbi:MAG: OFA family MFS transporter [Clostridiales bacterium]|nr:OFA family MFS transporter [Clostridiales bacterium]